MAFTDTLIARTLRPLTEADVARAHAAQAAEPVIRCGFDQPVGICRGCYWLLERPAFKPWCQKFDHVAGKLPGCGDKMHIREDV